MLVPIVTQVSGRVMALCTQALGLLKELLWRAASYSLASCILLFLSVANLYNLVVRTVLSIKAWLVTLTTRGLSTKQEPTCAKAKATLHGQQPPTTVLPTLRPVPLALSPKQDKPVAQTKSVPLPTEKTKPAPILTAVPSTQAGLKPQGRAKPRRRRAKQVSKKGS